MKKKKTAKTHVRKETTIVKRGWHVEPYDERKIYGSCVFACRMAHLSQKEAEKIAEHITPIITNSVKKKKFISSDDIYRMLIEELKKHDQDASFLYETHRDIS